MAPDSELGEVYRTLGRIEGRVQALEKRADRDSSAMKDAMETLLHKIEDMSASIEDLRMSRAQQRGGFAMLALMCGGAATFGGLIASWFRILFR